MLKLNGAKEEDERIERQQLRKEYEKLEDAGRRRRASPEAGT